MQVELLCNGGYTGIEPCIGKVFTVLRDVQGGVDLSAAELADAGFDDDGSGLETLRFFHCEVRVLDES